MAQLPLTVKLQGNNSDFILPVEGILMEKPFYIFNLSMICYSIFFKGMCLRGNLLKNDKMHVIAQTTLHDKIYKSEFKNKKKKKPILTHLFCCFSQELFGKIVPQRGHCHNPKYVIFVKFLFCYGLLALHKQISNCS